ncbi:MAG TPA: dephospho-CoA kinase [Nitrospiria bacterium]|nr:dephospho-CoA kinase [Nitrospiria bacterium]
MFVGLTGGIACGKTLVAHCLQSLGAHLIDADELAHRLLEPGQPGYSAVLNVFGPSILDQAEGVSPAPINRRRLGALIFADADQRRRLEAILHPLIFAEADRQRNALAAAHPQALIVFVAPLLFETGADRRVDRTIVVAADEATQAHRLIARDGLTREEAFQRIRAQWPVTEKAKRADETIDGARPPDEVKQQVAELYQRLMGREGTG